MGVAGLSVAALFVRWALPAPPVVTGFYRMLFASAAVGVLLLATGGLPRLPPRPLALALAAGVCFGGDLGLWHLALVETSVANATFLVNTTPIYVGVASWILGERLRRRLLLGGALAVAGATLLIGADLHALGSARGDGIALAAALFYSAYLLLMAAVRRDLDALPALFVAGVGATLTLGVLGLARGDAFAGFPARSWVAFLGAAGVSHLGGVLGIVWALRYLPASFASVALLGQPVGTAILGWALLGERLGPLQLLGGAAVVAGIAVAGRPVDTRRGN